MLRLHWLVMFFLAIGLSRFAHAGEAASVPPPTTQQVQQTVERAIGYLQTESAGWLKPGRCASCHHVAMPLWSLSEAQRQGYAIDGKFVLDTIEKTLGSPEKMTAAGIVANPAQPDPRPMGRGVSMGAVFMAVAARSLSSLQEGQKQSLRLIADDVVKKQQADGSWEFFLSRPPINENQATDGAWIIMSLQGEAGDASSRAALAKGMAWLMDSEPADNHQVKALKLLAAIRAGEPREKMQVALDALLALQQTDGGWPQMDGAASDAFATGQALYILALAGYTVELPPVKRAIDFLVASQKPDGSWPMTSRATPDGKPGGAKLLTPITCAASAWATLGLSRLAPKRPFRTLH